MINLDKIVNDNNQQHNEKWPYIADHPYRILMINCKTFQVDFALFILPTLNLSFHYIHVLLYCIAGNGY